jgi:hypothetical protein
MQPLRTSTFSLGSSRLWTTSPPSSPPRTTSGRVGETSNEFSRAGNWQGGATGDLARQMMLRVFVLQSRQTYARQAGRRHAQARPPNEGGGDRKTRDGDSEVNELLSASSAAARQRSAFSTLRRRRRRGRTNLVVAGGACQYDAFGALGDEVSVLIPRTDDLGKGVDRARATDVSVPRSVSKVHTDQLSGRRRTLPWTLGRPSR